MDYMQYAVYRDENGEIDLSYDYDAIQWMRQNVRGDSGHRRRDGAGLSLGRSLLHLHRPTDRHRLGLASEAAARRVRNAGHATRERRDRTSTRARTITTAVDFLRKYQVQYVIVGQLEHLYYPQEGLAKFPAMAGRELDLVFQNEKVQIYKVVNLPPLMPFRASRRIMTRAAFARRPFSPMCRI